MFPYTGSKYAHQPGLHFGELRLCLNHVEYSLSHVEYSLSHVEYSLYHVDGSLGHVECSQNRIECSLNHVERSQSHVKHSLSHVECPLNFESVDGSLGHVACSQNRIKCSLNHVGCSLFHVECSLNYVECSHVQDQNTRNIQSFYVILPVPYTPLCSHLESLAPSITFCTGCVRQKKKSQYSSMVVDSIRFTNPRALGGYSMTQLVKRAPPLIPQQLRGIIDVERSQDSL
jgi:hypothetical protein